MGRSCERNERPAAAPQRRSSQIFSFATATMLLLADGDARDDCFTTLCDHHYHPLSSAAAAATTTATTSSLNSASPLRPSVRPSVGLSVRPSVCPSVAGRSVDCRPVVVSSRASKSKQAKQVKQVKQASSQSRRECDRSKKERERERKRERRVWKAPKRKNADDGNNNEKKKKQKNKRSHSRRLLLQHLVGRFAGDFFLHPHALHPFIHGHAARNCQRELRASRLPPPRIRKQQQQLR